MKYKTCTKCGEELEATTEFFHKQKLGKDGLNAQCKNCIKEYDRKNHIKNFEREEYRIENVERIREWRKNNPDYNKKYRIENAEHIKQYRIDNIEYFKAYKKQYNKDNAAHIRSWGQKYYAEHIDHIKKRNKNNRDKRNANHAKRKALKLNQTPEFTKSEEKRIGLIYKESQKLGSGWQVDHITPLSKGGLHHPVNLQIVTKSYNLEKGAKLDFRLPTDEEIYNF